jgi:serine/threonine protein phosphatase 1
MTFRLVRKLIQQVMGSIRKPKGRIFAVGDVHGCADELRALLQQLPVDRDSTVVFVGDYIDRGPNSRGVVDTVLELGEYCNTVCLLGNHELMLREFLDGSDPVRVARFVYNGGSSTLASYADDEGRYVFPPEHIEFFQSLKYYHVDGEYCFVHAGLPVDVDQIDLDLHGEEMVWMRRKGGDADPELSKIVVHGHSTSYEVEITPRRIGLDTACVFGRKLSAIDLETKKVYQVARLAMPEPTYLHEKGGRRAAVRFEGKVPVMIPRGDVTLRFETINYSEIGILMRDIEPTGKPRLSPGEAVQGMIGPTEGAVAFKGVVLRVDGGTRYAVKILVEPPAP